MTDKQIIIDGVYVSGCDFYDKNKKYCLTLKMDTRGFKNPSCFSGDFQKCIQDSKVCPNTFCDNNPNCYYKQLKRKEQECEELKEQLKRKEENYQKLLNKSNKYIHNLVDENVQDISNLARQLEQLKAENDKLKQTLAEIKEIAEKEVKRAPDGETFARPEIKQILQKISESEVEND